MASPAAYDEPKKQSKKILFRFCSECSNLLFPKEDKAEGKLLYSCKTCSFQQDAPTSCVMRHEIASTVGDTAGITQDVGQDPTVGLTRSFSTTTLSAEEGVPGFCTMCGQELVCEDCGEESAPGLCFEAPDQEAAGDRSQGEAAEHSSKK
ncbi:hypothetical protein EJ04DRAFT_567515 [Polyplosphaeria fusca]|uniref:DNA-directed RNA polymerase II subunit RPB9-like zinc ribbon domain-containing protein n=1 Tax=Polyplosphaeria fusca TaxID=682080 RepID=A0A9P4QTH6_9PLEO|nr:hypothetical protein EJ04DRAFT_567515 [Polyplosphaeria fusca]